MANDMVQVTLQREDSTEWLLDLDEFGTPEMLEEYLKRYAPSGEYVVSPEGIWATRTAIRGAQDGFHQEAESESARWRAVGL